MSPPACVSNSPSLRLPSTAMWKRRLTLIVVATALVATACGGGDRSVLAIVNGTDEITTDDLELAISSQRAQTGAGGPVVLASTESRQMMTNLIVGHVIREPMAELGVDFPVLIGTGDANEGQIINAALFEVADVRLGIEEPGDEAAVIERALAELEPLDRPTCASHILTPDLDEAEAILDRLASGEEFGALAEELSTDPGSGANGGALGCRAPSGYVPEFSAALIELDENEVSGPVESSFGWHVILRTPDTDEIGEPVLFEARNQEISAWIVEVFEVAEIELDPSIGTWTGTGILPPDADLDPETDTGS